MYADFEERYGMISHMLRVYDRAMREFVQPEHKFQILNLSLAKTAKYHGLAKARELFERAFTLVSGADLIQVGLRFAKLERKLGEMDRARNIYAHLAQFCNPDSSGSSKGKDWS